MKIKEIIKKYLEENGYDGLYNDECGCSKDDLFPCDFSPDFCEPGYKCHCDKHCDEYSECFTGEKHNKCWKEEE
jgi:hypothetical protein